MTQQGESWQGQPAFVQEVPISEHGICPDPVAWQTVCFLKSHSSQLFGAFTGYSGLDDGFQGFAGELANISIRVKLEIKNQGLERWLGVHTARIEDQAQLSETMLGDSQPPRTLSSGGPTPFSGLCGCLPSCAHTDAQTHTHVHVIKNIKNLVKTTNSQFS